MAGSPLSEEKTSARRAEREQPVEHPAQRRGHLERERRPPRLDLALGGAQRCFEDQLGERRTFVGHIIAQFENALESQDPRTVDAARAELTRALDSIEGETWL